MRLIVTPQLIERIHELATTASSISGIASELNVSYHIVAKNLTPAERERFNQYKKVTPDERETWCYQYSRGLATVAELCEQNQRNASTIRLHLRKGNAKRPTQARPTDDRPIISEREAQLDRELVKRIVAENDRQRAEISDWLAVEMASIC